MPRSAPVPPVFSGKFTSRNSCFIITFLELCTKIYVIPFQYNRDFGLAILGSYNEQVAEGQTVKLTIDVMSAIELNLMVNLLEQTKFTWHGGKVIPIKAGQDGVMTVTFQVEGDVTDTTLFIHALLIPDGMDYSK